VIGSLARRRVVVSTGTAILIQNAVLPLSWSGNQQFSSFKILTPHGRRPRKSQKGMSGEVVTLSKR
jgi:hypothetical protein